MTLEEKLKVQNVYFALEKLYISFMDKMSKFVLKSVYLDGYVLFNPHTANPNPLFNGMGPRATTHDGSAKTHDTARSDQMDWVRLGQKNTAR